MHDISCSYDGMDPAIYEKCYTDILSILSSHGAKRRSYDLDPSIPKAKLKNRIANLPGTETWLGLHDECLTELNNHRVVLFTGSGIRLADYEERVERVIPTFDPLKTIYEHGPVSGGLDYGVYTMVSWCSLKSMTWEQTFNFVSEWLDESGSWEREDWSERSITEVVNGKKRIWRNDMGWGDMARAAAEVIRESDVEKQLDARSRRDLTAEDFDD